MHCVSRVFEPELQPTVCTIKCRPSTVRIDLVIQLILDRIVSEMVLTKIEQIYRVVLPMFFHLNNVLK